MQNLSNAAGQCLLSTGAQVMYRLHPDSREKVIGLLTSLPDKKCSLKVYYEATPSCTNVSSLFLQCCTKCHLHALMVQSLLSLFMILQI